MRKFFLQNKINLKIKKKGQESGKKNPRYFCVYFKFFFFFLGGFSFHVNLWKIVSKWDQNNKNEKENLQISTSEKVKKNFGMGKKRCELVQWNISWYLVKIFSQYKHWGTTLNHWIWKLLLIVQEERKTKNNLF